MTTIDKYLKGNHKITELRLSFDTVFSKNIVDDPSMASIFSKSKIARNSYGKLKSLVKYLLTFFPNIDIDKYFKACLENSSNLNNIYKKFKKLREEDKEAFSIITEGICGALQVFDQTLDYEIQITGSEISSANIIEILQLKTVRHGKKFKNKKQKGSISESTKYILALIKNNRLLTSKQLHKLANKSIVKQSYGRFANLVSELRKRHNLKK